MKIAIIGSRGYPIVYSGYETFISNVAPRLVSKGVEVHIYCHSKLFVNKPTELNGIYLHYMPVFSSKSLSQLSNSLFSTLHALFCSYDLILYVNVANGLFGPLTKLFGVKTAINVDGLEWLRPKWKGLGAKIFMMSAKMATRWMSVIVTDADEMRRVYLKEFNRDSTVIAYGANLRTSTNKERISKWGLIERDYYLIVGRLIPDNNADFIIGEFVQSKSLRKLVIVGDVPYNDAYANAVKSIKDERLVFTGYINDQDDLAELYHNCFMYLHGHEFGGTNPTLLKALAYGCAILAIDTTFSREVLSDDEFGVYFKKEITNLTAIFNEFENNYKHLDVLRSKSRLRIMDKYTWEKISNDYQNLFSQMISK
jgi:glycosyltransferase involved in cell wall biosynthesis